MRPAGWPPKNTRTTKKVKARRAKPLPPWLAAVILLGALGLIILAFALRLGRAGYEGPDIYPEFRELKKQYLALEQDKAAKGGVANEGEGKTFPRGSTGEK